MATKNWQNSRANMIIPPSNLYDPKATISSLFQPATHKLSPRTIAVYISSATKIFGTWAASVSESWSAEAHADVKAVVKTAVDALLSLGDGMELEVQERVSGARRL
jgi:AP-3 complex subunit delta